MFVYTHTERREFNELYLLQVKPKLHFPSVVSLQVSTPQHTFLPIKYLLASPLFFSFFLLDLWSLVKSEMGVKINK